MTKPNVLILMADQLQSEVLDLGHPCPTPHIDAVIERGIRPTGAVTPNAICSPARASLMTGLLPHNHGVLVVTHTTDDDQSCLRTEHPHFAQALSASGYRTGYFGKWHVERSNALDQFGWQEQVLQGDPTFVAWRDRLTREEPNTWHHEGFVDGPEGYRRQLFFGVRSGGQPLGMDVVTATASDFLDRQLASDDPWCCFVSVSEPHDPFICEQHWRDQIDADAIDLPASLNDPMSDKPGLYRKARRVYDAMTMTDHREARACYYASIAQLDDCFGRLLDQVAAAGQLDNTIVIICADHGEHLGAHGLYCKNIGAFDEALRVPLVLAGPGITAVGHHPSRLGLQDLAPTITRLCGSDFPAVDGRDATPLLKAPHQHASDWQVGFSEYHGGRTLLTQRICWVGNHKLVLNGFDDDELYDLAIDPGEQVNRIDDPAYAAICRSCYETAWQIMIDSNDHSVVNTQYPATRFFRYGPDIVSAG